MTKSMRKTCELAIVGGGPAGLAAATLAAELGVEAVLFDEQPMPGGQIYRSVETTSRRYAQLSDILGKSYTDGLALVQRFRASGAGYEPASAVWQVAVDGTLGISQGGSAYLTRARRVILATGAMERAFPIPGWTLPGVMGVGAAQTLMKQSALVPDRPVIIAGSGPLIYLVAFQMIRAGAPLQAIIDTSEESFLKRGLAALPFLMGASEDVLRGIAWIAAIKAKRIPIVRGRRLAVEGDSHVQAVSFENRGKRTRLPTSILLLHEGLIPNNQITVSLRCAHTWDEGQFAWRPERDVWGATSAAMIAVAGDGAGIAGARAALHRGRLAALDAAYRLGRLAVGERDERARLDRRALEKESRFRAFLDRAYRPVETMRSLADETIVCRCEEVSAGELRSLISAGFTDINQLKSFSRCGMGQCQGRVCTVTVGRLLCEHLEKSMEAVGYYRTRLPVKPLPLAQLATLANADRSSVPASASVEADPSQRI